jgi:hypothetical protein
MKSKKGGIYKCTFITMKKEGVVLLGAHKYWRLATCNKIVTLEKRQKQEYGILFCHKRYLDNFRMVVT